MDVWSCFVHWLIFFFCFYIARENFQETNKALARHLFTVRRWLGSKLYQNRLFTNSAFFVVGGHISAFAICITVKWVHGCLRFRWFSLTVHELFQISAFATLQMNQFRLMFLFYESHLSFRLRQCPLSPNTCRIYIQILFSRIRSNCTYRGCWPVTTGDWRGGWKIYFLFCHSS